MTGKKHQWNAENEESRNCPICGLQDTRLGTGYSWKIEANIPCIEPVPYEIEYEVLAQELRDHGVEEDFHPTAFGHPGDWHVGFFGRTSGSGTALDPAVHLKAGTLNQGWAWLLRYMRVRKFKPDADKYYYLANKDQTTFKISPDLPYDPDN